MSLFSGAVAYSGSDTYNMFRLSYLDRIKRRRCFADKGLSTFAPPDTSICLQAFDLAQPLSIDTFNYQPKPNANIDVAGFRNNLLHIQPPSYLTGSATHNGIYNQEGGMDYCNNLADNIGSPCDIHNQKAFEKSIKSSSDLSVCTASFDCKQKENPKALKFSIAAIIGDN